MEQQSNILEEILASYYQLTSSERHLADFVLSQYSRVQFMSISELAEASEVSESTVSRFCKNIGLRGFSQFKIELAGYVASTAPAKDTAETDADNLENRTRESGRLVMEAVHQTIEMSDAQAIEQAVDYLVSAGHVLCIGSGGSMIIATECAHLFSLVTHKFTAISDSHRQLTSAATMDTHDAIILFSYSGATTDGIDVLQFAKSRGIRTILVTRFKKSPAAKLADIVLCCGSCEGPYQVGSIPAAVAQLIIIDVLFKEYCFRNREKAEERIRQVAAAVSVKHI